MNKDIFCSRKGGATIKGKFYPRRTSEIIAKEIERKNNKIEAREKRRQERLV